MGIRRHADQVNRSWKPVFSLPMWSLCTLFFALLCALSIPSVAHANTSTNKKSIPFERLESGQYVIDVQINQSAPLKFMIDTAASRTSLFDKTSKALNLPTGQSEKFINGMTESSFRPTGKIDSLRFGEHRFNAHTIIILKDWEPENDMGIDGILGMDVLHNLILTFSHELSQVKISKYAKYSRSRYRRWHKINLTPNPYPGKKFGLMFTYTKLGDLAIPTLLDTGANFSALNWMSVKGTKISREKRRLREEWVVQGSVGDFKPRMRIRLAEVNIGGKKLLQHEFLVMNFDNFPINGNGKYPLIIAGIDLIDGNDFTLDFANNHIYIARSDRKLRVGHRASRIDRQVDK